ncbi:ATP-binding protein [Streptomyces sp. HD1123-B1]|uniref:ATP-binding protein n=1 Tax=Streptomyces huangiella TaxID=3228804 RepID=UPI003D7C5ED9
MAVPHGPAGVRAARQWMRGDLGRTGVSESVIDDAVLILSELLSNAWRHGRPWRSDQGDDTVRAAWSVDEDERLTVEVTDGGGPTRPLPAKPSVTARGGRGLHIIRTLADDWGVRDGVGEVTVWALLPADDGFMKRVTIPADLAPGLTDLDPGLTAGLADGLTAGLTSGPATGLIPGPAAGPTSGLGTDPAPGPGRTESERTAPVAIPQQPDPPAAKPDTNIPETNIDPDFDRELDFADLDELA